MMKDLKELLFEETHEACKKYQQIENEYAYENGELEETTEIVKQRGVFAGLMELISKAGLDDEYDSWLESKGLGNIA